MLGDVNGILVPGGFGLRGVEGMILAARYARENKMAYLGLCLGMQASIFLVFKFSISERFVLFTASFLSGVLEELNERQTHRVNHCTQHIHKDIEFSNVDFRYGSRHRCRIELPNYRGYAYLDGRSTK